MSGVEDQRGSTMWPVAVCGMVFAYLLSPMPIAKALTTLYGSSAIPRSVVKTFNAIYWPLEWLMKHSETASSFYDWYERVWRAF